MALYRDHRGSLSDSMKTCREIKSMDELRTHLENIFDPYPVGTITVKPYAYDHRIEWETYVVCVEGNAVGFSNGPME